MRFSVVSKIAAVLFGFAATSFAVAQISPFVPLVPAGLLDSRPGGVTIDGQSAGGGPLASFSITNFTVLGRDGIPASGVNAVALNVTVMNATGAGYVTFYPAGAARPLASNLNILPSQSISNQVIVPVGTGGQVSIFTYAGTSGSANVIVDVAGYYLATNDFKGLTPARLLDTRAGATTIDGQSAGGGAVGPASSIDLLVSGRGGVPATGVSAIVINVTATNPTTSAFVTAWPTGSTRPLASNLNFIAGQTVPNLVIVGLGTGGKMSLFNSAGSTDLIADVVGYFPSTADFTSLVPARLLDTRAGATTVDGQFAGVGSVPSGGTLNLTVLGRGGVPIQGVGAVALNVTSAGSSAAGYITAWGTGTTTGNAPPAAMDVNFTAGSLTPSLVIAQVGANGQVSLYNSNGITPLVADVVGWFPTQSSTAAAKYYISNQCYLPGPNNNSSACMVYWGYYNSPVSDILCLWNTNNSLYACNAVTNFALRYEYVTAPASTLEIRHHTTYPTADPSWPNAALVRSHGTLLETQTVTAIASTSPTGTCSVTLSSGADVASAVSAASNNAVICLQAGSYVGGTTIYPKSGQIIRSVSSGSPATIYNNSGSSTEAAIYINQPNVTIRDVAVAGYSTSRPGYGIEVANTFGARLYNVALSYELIGLVVDTASDVEMNSSSISYAGDGVACSGSCAQPSMYIHNSDNIRVISSTLLNNGVGTGGDGELACYNTTNLLVQDSSVQNSGAAGMYIVSCDQARVLHNTITNAQEWGLDIVDTGYSSGSDFGLYDSNTVTHSGNAGGVLLDSQYDVFSSNTFSGNRVRSGASGSCDAVNVRGSSNTGFQYFPNNVVNSSTFNNSEGSCSDD